MLSPRKGFYVDRNYPDAIFMMPKKKSRVKELTAEEKTQNKVISSIRVRVEHAIAGIKRIRITTDMFRSKKFRNENNFHCVDKGRGRRWVLGIVSGVGCCESRRNDRRGKEEHSIGC